MRIEHDALGPINVPKDALYGSFTVRARTYFNLSGQKVSTVFFKALGLVKLACAKANTHLKQLDPKLAKAIEKAAFEYSQGKFISVAPLDPFQAGSGTPLNMHANEIIANRANQLLGKPLGSYDPVHPNNHVNMAQSTNDVIPTATRVAALFQNGKLLNSLNKLIVAFNRHVSNQKNQNQIKVGRTHLQDAVPMTISQEFSAWRDMLKKDFANLTDLQKHLEDLGIGGNAIGSGINSHPEFKQTVVKILKNLTKFNLRPTHNTFETTQSVTPLLNFSAGLRSLASDLIKIANDLKLLNMGPKAGIGEIILPDIEPGSSIMPGKVNPSIVEALEMTCFQVIGNDHVIALASHRGQLQLNIFAPLIMFNLLWSIELLKNTIEMFRKYCVNGLKINYTRCQELFDQSLCMATALSPHLGYHQTALLVNEALKINKNLKQLVLEKNLLPKKKLEKILSPKALTKPRIME